MTSARTTTASLAKKRRRLTHFEFSKSDSLARVSGESDYKRSVDTRPVSFSVTLERLQADEQEGAEVAEEEFRIMISLRSLRPPVSEF
jgi:hypothetical protein